MPSACQGISGEHHTTNIRDLSAADRIPTSADATNESSLKY
jgi:hypothetical protein